MTTKTVLIVEDNLAYLRQLTESLAGARDEFDLVSAENGQEAINLLERSAIDVVVTDLNMPIMDGFALLSHLRESFPQLPAVVLTGLTRPDVFERLKVYGDLKILQKPVTPEAFVGTLRTVLEKAAQGKLKGVTLPNLLQLLSLERRTCSLLIEMTARRGSLHFVSGELVDAYIFDEQLAGEEAAAELLRWTEARVELRNVGDEEKPRDRFVKSSLEDMLAAAYPHEERAALPQVRLVEVQADAPIHAETSSEEEAENSSDVQASPLPEQSETSEFNLEDHVVASQSQAEQTHAQILAEEASMLELRQQLITEGETLQETFQRLQQRAQEADEALSAVLGEFETFREQQRSYQEAEEAYQAKRKNLEQWREGAEDLAKKLLSAVQKVDEGDVMSDDANEDSKSDDEKQVA